MPVSVIKRKMARLASTSSRVAHLARVGTKKRIASMTGRHAAPRGRLARFARAL
jgi:hypothetical protein